MYYVETVGTGFAAGLAPVAYRTLEAARQAYYRDVASGSYLRVRLYDCTKSPVGELVANSEGTA